MQPIGTRNCTDEAAPKVDMGERWLLGLNHNKATHHGDFLGLIGNCGTGRCMQYRKAPVNHTVSPSEYDAITYGTITSEVCDETNDAQMFYLKNYTNPHVGHGIVPKIFGQSCPAPLEPTIIGGPLPSLVAFGCGIGEWNRQLITAAYGYYYLNITTNQYQKEVDSAKYGSILCCINEDTVKDGDWWDGVCTAFFPNYKKYESGMRKKKQKGGS
ncbi:hypothetical protein AA313_de0207897 [Arthrobotrys entomopaga]|nr:hypothetical protein AA313_de0207897 [Arthrobotrys entomopaga]